jgi:Icc protein
MITSTNPLSILQITDLHLLTESGQKMSGVDTERSFCEVLEYAHTQHDEFDLILVTGDLTQDPSQFGYERIYQELEKYPSRAVCLPGNHDDPALMEQYIAGERINCKKQILFDNWQLINLNSKKPKSEGGRLEAEELDLIGQAIEKHPDLNALIAIHHHPLPTQSAWLDTMVIENGGAFFSVMEQYPQIKAITCGHIHQELETTKNNILILGTPSTCFQFKPHCTNYALDDKHSGYRIFQLFPDGKIITNVYYL